MWKKILGWSAAAIVFVGILIWSLPEFTPNCSHNYVKASSCGNQVCTSCGDIRYGYQHTLVKADCLTDRCTLCGYIHSNNRHDRYCTDWVCEDCGQTVAGTGRVHKETEIVAANGCTTQSRCKACGEMFTSTRHTLQYKSKNCVHEEWCTKCDYTSYRISHFWTGDCNESVTCRSCAAVQSGPVAHEYNNYMFGLVNVCRICGRIAFFAGHFSSLAFVFPGALLVLIALVIVIIKFRNSGEGDRKTKFIGFIENYQRPGLKGNGRLGDALTVHILKDDETPPD